MRGCISAEATSSAAIEANITRLPARAPLRSPPAAEEHTHAELVLNFFLLSLSLSELMQKEKGIKKWFHAPRMKIRGFDFMS